MNLSPNPNSDWAESGPPDGQRDLGTATLDSARPEGAAAPALHEARGDSIPAAPPTYPLTDFALAPPRRRDAIKDFGMRAAGWMAVGLNGAFGSRSQGKLALLTYHRVANHIPGLPPPTHNVTPERFRQQLVGLLNRGFQFWPLSKVLSYRAAGRLLPDRTVVVTFDDGFQTVYTEAWPTLRELRIPAAMFVNTAYLDSTSPFPFDIWGLEHQRDLPPVAYRPLTLAQCREMAAGGLIEFGAHTHTHRDMRSNPALFRRDLQTSVDIVREKFSIDVVMFAFPFGSKQRGFAGAELVAAAKQTGVQCGLTTECTLVDLRDDPFAWGRFNAFSWDTAATLGAKLDGWYGWAAKMKRACVGEATPETVSLRSVAELRKPWVAPPAALRRRPVTSSQRVANAHVVSLVNILPPYARPVYLELARRVGKLTILLSSPLGLHGVEEANFDSLDVRVQKTWTLRRRQHHPLRFDEQVDIHLPWRTVGELNELQPDIVFSHETGFRSLLSSYYTHVSRRVPLALAVGMTEHTERGRGAARYLLRRWLFRQADAVGVNGLGTARYVAGLGVPRERMFHMPYVAVPDNKTELPITRDAATAHHLLYVGQFIERKGLLPFLATLAHWGTTHPDRRVEFSLVGSGPQEEALRAFPLPPNVALRIVGRRKPDELAPIYATAGILVLPTLADEWGLVVNEAMSAGLPVLGSVYSQAVSELCGDGATGWTFRTDASEEMERAISSALSTSVEQLNAMRKVARQRVAHLTPDYVAGNMLEVIERLLTR